MPDLSTWRELPAGGRRDPGTTPSSRAPVAGARASGPRSTSRALRRTACSAGSTAPTRRSRSTARRSPASTTTFCKGCEICAEVCPVAGDRDGRAESTLEAASHRRRGGRARDAPDRPGRRPGLPDHAADADHPGLREVRRGRSRARRARQRRVRALGDERRDRLGARRRAHDHGDVVAGARADGGGRLHRRVDARADRHGARQPGAFRADQHPLRPLRLDADPRLRRRAALRRERAGGLRPDGRGAADRRASRRAAAGARLPGRLHDHARRRAGRAARRRGRARRSSGRTTSRSRCSTSHVPATQGPFAMPDYYFELRRQQAAALDDAQVASRRVVGSLRGTGRTRLSGARGVQRSTTPSA